MVPEGEGETAWELDALGVGAPEVETGSVAPAVLSSGFILSLPRKKRKATVQTIKIAKTGMMIVQRGRRRRER